MVIAFLRPSPLHPMFKNDPTIKGGRYNGYVGYKGEKTPDVEVHGGITLDVNFFFENGNEYLIPLTSIPEPEELKEYHVIGFDTLHLGDTAEEWTFEKTKEETLKLKKQLEDLGY